MSTNPLHQLMSPKSIATVGAGNNPMKMGTIQALSIVKDGYAGKFLPVHPREKTVFGYQAYPSVLDLPEAPDLAMFVVPTDQVAQLLEDFGKIGTKYAVIVTAGFRETGADGKVMEDELKAVAAKYGIRFLGPNCIGILNTQVSLNLTVMPWKDKPGILGMASQSGTYVTQTLPYLQKRGIRFSKGISVGNEANIDIVDALEYLGEDEDTRAVALYIEGIRDVRRFLEVARKVTARKPVVAQYVGGSAAGARAGASHTGSMAGPDYLYEGLFKQAGIIRVNSIEDLYSHGWVLATQPPLKGNRLGIVTNSGGPGTALSNTADQGGMELPVFSETLQEEIRPYLPAQASSANPIDLTFHLDAQVLSTKIPELIMKSGEVDGLILHGPMSFGMMKELYPHIADLTGNIPLETMLQRYQRDLSYTVSLPGKYQVPMVISSYFGREDNYTEAYQDNNIPVFDGPEKAAKGMLALLAHKQIRERQPFVPPDVPNLSADAAEVIEKALARGQSALDEYESKRVLAAYGIPVTAEKLAFTEDEAVEAALSLGLPVAVKGCSAEIAHKTEKGLVHLNLADTQQVREAFLAVRDAAGHIPTLVSKMARGTREFTAGMIRHPAFGPCILFGLGGVFTEALKDVTFRVAPLSAAEAGEMILDIRAGKLLGGFRGQPPVDLSGLSLILQKLSYIAMLHPQIEEIDMNPLIISGANPVVADALLILKG